MAKSPSGKGDWTDAELDLIVAEYFSMLTPEPGAARGWKTARLKKLDEKIERGEGSIGRKLSNITFVAATWLATAARLRRAREYPASYLSRGP